MIDFAYEENYIQLQKDMIRNFLITFIQFCAFHSEKWHTIRVHLMQEP